MMWSTKEVSDIYSELAETWDSKSSAIKDKVGNSNRLKMILPDLLKETGGKILDFGSGTGKIYQSLLLMKPIVPLHVIMVDASNEMCRMAREKISDEIPAHVIHGDENSPCIAEYAPYKIITMMQVLHHLPTPQKTLSILRKYSTEDTILLILVPGPFHQSNIFPYQQNACTDKMGRFEPERLGELISAAGWYVQEIYDDRFSIIFSSREDYISFIIKIGMVSKILGYKKYTDLDISKLKIDSSPTSTYGHHLTFVCKVKKD